MKKLFTLLTTAAMLCNMFAVTSFAEESDKPTSNTAITAVKTAQWRATESDSTTYDLRIHGWSGWETAAYMGFELPENFNVENVGKAELVLDTTSVANSERHTYMRLIIRLLKTVCNTLLHRHIPKKKLCRSHHRQIQANLKLM